MPEISAPPRRSFDAARLCTNLCAGGWGFWASHLLFRSLLVAREARLCCLALVPLVAVWATLERKRWGRLTLLGLSQTALVLFGVALVYAVSVRSGGLQTTESLLGRYLGSARLLFTDSPLAVMVALALATVTGLWFCRPVVIAEFERGKRSTLAIGQSVIALTLVVCWGLTILFTPRAAEGTAKVHPYHAPKKAARTARR